MIILVIMVIILPIGNHDELIDNHDGHIGNHCDPIDMLV